MSTRDASGRTRTSKGTPDGGRFAVDPKAEGSVTLVDELPTTIDRQHRRSNTVPAGQVGAPSIWIYADGDDVESTVVFENDINVSFWRDKTTGEMTNDIEFYEKQGIWPHDEKTTADLVEFGNTEHQETLARVHAFNNRTARTVAGEKLARATAEIARAERAADEARLTIVKQDILDAFPDAESVVLFFSDGSGPPRPFQVYGPDETLIGYEHKDEASMSVLRSTKAEMRKMYHPLTVLDGLELVAENRYHLPLR